MSSPGYGPNGKYTQATGRVTWDGGGPPKEHSAKLEAPEISPFGMGLIPQLDTTDTEVIRIRDYGGSF